MTYYVLLFIAGLAGSFHCIGMCGGFACALGGDPRGPSATSLRHLLYNSGRLTTYCFLGGFAGGLGQVICTYQGLQPSPGLGPGLGIPFLSESFSAGQRSLAVVAGLLMIIMSLQFFGLRGFHRVTAGFGGTTFAMSLRSLLATHGYAAPLAFGVFNGFLPCPLVYAMVFQAASTGGSLPGCLTMVSFGLGTFPAMLAMGGVSRRLAPAWRRRGVRLAGSFILALGLVTLGRGIVPMVSHAAAHGWHIWDLA
jgi:sulfite exporter TauE/SafE